MLEAVAEEGAIWQPGQRVMERLVLELALQSNPIGDITRADDHRALAIEDRLARIDLDVDGASSLGAVANPLEMRAPSAHGMQVRLQHAAILRRTDVGQREREEFGAAVAVHRERCAV